MQIVVLKIHDFVEVTLCFRKQVNERLLLFLTVIEASRTETKALLASLSNQARLLVHQDLGHGDRSKSLVFFFSLL